MAPLLHPEDPAVVRADQAVNGQVTPTLIDGLLVRLTIGGDIIGVEQAHPLIDANESGALRQAEDVGGVLGHLERAVARGPLPGHHAGCVQGHPKTLLVPGQVQIDHPPRRHVTEHEDGPDDPATIVPDRGGVVVDVPLCAVPGDEERAHGQADDFSLPQRPKDGVVHRPACLLAHDPKNRVDSLPGGFDGSPTRERLGHGVQGLHPAFGVGDEHGIADAVQGDPQPLPLPHRLVGLGFQASSGITQGTAE